jgi:hypothetical protein
MTSSDLARWGGVAALAGGALLVAKGALVAASDADPGLVPPATLLFALGMVGLHARLQGRGGPLGLVGAVLAWVAVGASVVNLVGLALGIPAPGDPEAPTLLQATYTVAFLGILIGLFALGIAASGAEALSPSSRSVTLAVGVLWFPLQGVGFAISDGVGLVLGGLAWALLGHVLRSESGTPAEQPARVPRA